MLPATASENAVTRLPATAMLPAVPIEPATAALATVAADPVIPALATVAAAPATAALATVAAEPATAELSTVATDPATALPAAVASDSTRPLSVSRALTFPRFTTFKLTIHLRVGKKDRTGFTAGGASIRSSARAADQSLPLREASGGFVCTEPAWYRDHPSC